MDHVDRRKVDSIAGATARAGAWISPTLNVFNSAFAGRESDSAIRSRPDWQMIPPTVREPYLRARTNYWSATALEQRTEARRRTYIATRNALVKAIQDSGGKLLAGSDTPEWFHVYGWGLHRELEALVAAGLTPFQALAAGSRNAAEYVGGMAEWGTIEPGKRADLVLLEANPLADIRNVGRIQAVAVGGRLLTRDELDRLVAAGRQAINGGAPPGDR
jgi:hypothetical protein